MAHPRNGAVAISADYIMTCGRPPWLSYRYDFPIRSDGVILAQTDINSTRQNLAYAQEWGIN